MVQFNSHELAVAGPATRQPRQGRKEEQAPPGSETVLKVRKSAFLREETSGTRVRSIRGRERGIQSEWVSLDEHIKEEYRIFLKDHAEGLLRLYNNHQEILQSEPHRHDEELFNMFTSERRNADGTIKKIIDEQKIEGFLKKPEGWMVTTQLLEHQTAMQLFALGLHAAANPQGERNALGGKVTIPLGIDQGILNRLGREVVEGLRLNEFAATFGGRRGEARILGLIRAPWADNLRRWHVAGITGGASALGIAGTAMLGPEAMIGAGIAPWAFQWLQASIGTGVQVDMRQCSAAFQAIRTNPTEVEYVKEVFGVDMRDFVDLGYNQIGLAPHRAVGGNLETYTDVNNLRNNAVGNIITRMEFYTKIGVPLEKLDALPEQFLYLYTNQQEQTGTEWQRRIQEVFLPNAGGIRDINGNNIETAPGVPNPAFDANNLDFAGNISRYMDARRQIMVGMVRDMIQEERSAAASLDQSKQAITQMITERRSEGYRQRRTERLGQERTRLEAYRNILDGQTGAFTIYNQTITELNEERTNLATELSRTFAGAFGGDVDAALTSARSILSTPGTTITINGNVIASTRQRFTDLDAWRSTEIADIKNHRPAHLDPTDDEYPVWVQSERERILSDYQNQKADIQADVNIINQQIENLEGFRTRVTVAERRLENNEEGQPSRILIQQLEGWERDRAQITGWGTPANVLDNAFLASGDIDAIMARINTANAATPANGWPEARNNDPAYRTRVFQAVLESRAQVAEAADTTRAARLPDYVIITNPAVWNISQNELRHMTPADLTAALTARAPALGGIPIPNPAQIENAIREAQNRIQVRLGAITEQTRITDEAIENRRFQIEGVNFDDEIRQLETALTLLNRQQDIIAGRPTRENRATFTDRTVMAGDTTYSQSERDVGSVRGYYEFMNLLFNYRERGVVEGVDRDEYFRRISQVLPPARLGQLLNEALGLGGSGINLNTVLARLDARLASGQINDRDMVRVLFNVIERNRLEALALS